jgi:hypothetical protein
LVGQDTRLKSTSNAKVVAPKDWVLRICSHRKL